MKTVLILGGGRFVGKSFVEMALEAGYSVTVITRGRSALPFADRVHHLIADRQHLKQVHLPTRHYDAVVDTCAYDVDDFTAIASTIGEITQRYIVASSQSVYGPGPALTEDMFVPEEHAWTLVADRNTDYAEAKRQLESTVARLSPVPWVALRFSMIVGPDDYTRRLQWHKDRIVSGEPIYMPNRHARLTFLHQHDAARAMLAMITSKDVGAFNVASPEPLAVGSIAEAIAAKVGRTVVWGSTPTTENASPYGIEDDWWMDTSRLRLRGIDIPAYTTDDVASINLHV